MAGEKGFSYEPRTSSGTIIDIQSGTIRRGISLKGKEGRSYKKTPWGYINGYGMTCWTESYVSLIWRNNETGYRQYEDIRETLKFYTNDARLTQKRIERFLELNIGKTVELVWEDHRWRIANLENLDYDIL